MGYIFEREIDNIILTVKANTIGERESIRLREIRKSPIHTALKAYYKEKVTELLREERSKEVRSKRLPYALPEITVLQEHMDTLLVWNYEFDQQEFDTITDEAVHFEFNYLCRPQWTLLSFLLGNRRTVSASEIDRKLRYCIDYPYYARILRRHIADKGLAEVSYEELKNFIETIDREIVARHSGRDLARMMRTLFLLLHAAQTRSPESNDPITIPTNAAIVFFEDKHLDAVQNRLEELRDQEHREDLTMAELSDILVSVHQAEIGADEPASSVLLSTVSSETEAPAPPPVIAAPVDAANRIEVQTAEIEAAVEPAAPAAEADAAAEPEDVQEQSMASVFQAPPTELPDLFEYLDESDRKRFLKKLFKKDEEAFRTVLTLLNGIATWEEASIAIDRMFVERDIDPFAAEAVRFTDMISSRYKER